MRKYVAPETFEYLDGDTSFVTTDKALAIIVFEYAKTKSAADFDSIKDECIQDLDSDIKRLKEEIKADDK